MGYIAEGRIITTQEVDLIAGLNALAISGATEAIQKTGAETFVNTDFADFFVLKSGDTMEGALIAYAHESTGLIPQVTNSYYGTDATPPAGTYVEGDSYDQIEA